MYAIAEIVAAICACAVLQGLVPGDIAVTPAPGAGTNRAQAVFIEMFLTAARCVPIHESSSSAGALLCCANACRREVESQCVAHALMWPLSSQHLWPLSG